MTFTELSIHNVASVEITDRRKFCDFDNGQYTREIIITGEDGTRISIVLVSERDADDDALRVNL